jgi:serine/threonine-protein kinase
MTTTLHDFSPTLACNKNARQPEHDNELTERYERVLLEQRLSWTTHQGLLKLLGRGGQGVVYLSELRGADGFTLPIALKVFSPARYETPRNYEEAMARMAHVAARVAQIQQDNLLDVHNFVDRHRIRMMSMEWIDGFDLRQVLCNQTLGRIADRVSRRRWEYLNRVVVTAGPVQPRVKPGVAVAIVRDCLAALAALHREGIVHGDVKPANIMLKRSGTAKIIDIGSAFEVDDPPLSRTCTPRYAAPEVLEGGEATARSDLASLGYVLIEMLSGIPIFPGMTSYRDLLAAKRSLSQQLENVLPFEVACNELLMAFCRGLIAPDPMRRFPTAEEADLLQNGAAAFQRQLVRGDLSAEYDNEIRLWVEELRELLEFGEVN